MSHLQSIIEKCPENIKDIPWFEWRYAVTEDWRVWSYKKNWWYWHDWIFMKMKLEKKWYHTVCLSIWDKTTTQFVHRLVAKAFIPNTEWKPFINHKNWIRNDNRIENLEWCTPSENILHSFSSNGRKPVGTIPIIQMTLDWKEVARFESAQEAQRKTWFSQSNISKCIRWWYKQSYWFKWIKANQEESVLELIS